MSKQNIKKIKRVEFILLMVYGTPLNSKLRKELENNLDLNSETATDKIKLITILNPSTPSGIKAVTSFIQRSLELRREG